MAERQFEHTRCNLRVVGSNPTRGSNAVIAQG